MDNRGGQYYFTGENIRAVTTKSQLPKKDLLSSSFNYQGKKFVVTAYSVQGDVVEMELTSELQLRRRIEEGNGAFWF